MRDSWAEYDEASSKAVHERPLHYLCYEIECINPDTGEKLHFFKVIKFLRVIRLPKGAKQSTSLMDMHTQIIAGANENAYNLVTVIANIIKPIPLGLLFLKGMEGMGGKNVNPDSQRTLEESVAGMADHEYVVQILSTPVFTSTLKEWAPRTERDMTDWNGQL